MSQQHTTQEEINAVAWSACDTFRGIIDPAQYKNYILTMLFVKYLSDVWKDTKEELEKKFGGDKDRIQRRLERERFRLKDEHTFDYLYQNRTTNNVGELINIALEGIEEDNRETLENIFRGIDFNSETSLGETRDRNKRLKNLLEDFNKPALDLRPSRIGGKDIIGNVYEYLISRFASDAGKKGGEFYTPPEVATLLARLLRPQSGNRIGDPTCGSGSLLIKVAHEVGSDNYSLFGQELNGDTWALCKMNMFLHNIENARIEWGDTLNNPKLIEGDRLMKYDVVVANPPFSLDKWGADTAGADPFNRFFRGIPPKSKGDFAFITHMVETAVTDTGRVGVILPHGVLFRGASEGKIRQALIEENLLEAVVGLPANLFYGTGIPACILIFNRARKTKDILFIDASRDFEAGKNQNKLRPADLDKVVKTYTAFKTVDKYAYRARFEEVKENEFNLNIPRYVDTFEEEEEIDIAATQKEIEKLEEELVQVRKEMKGYLRELGIVK
jgi:type I restriction enzyme M protein